MLGKVTGRKGDCLSFTSKLHYSCKDKNKWNGIRIS